MAHSYNVDQFVFPTKIFHYISSDRILPRVMGHAKGESLSVQVNNQYAESLEYVGCASMCLQGLW